MLTRFLLPLLVLVPLLALALAYLSWQLDLWPLSMVLAAYAVIWILGAVSTGGGMTPLGLSWGTFFLRYFLMVGIGTVTAIIGPGRVIALLIWAVVFVVALVLRDQFNDLVALVAIAAYVVALSWSPVAKRMSWRRHGAFLGRDELPTAAAAMLGLTAHPMLAAAPVIQAVVVGGSLLPYVDALGGWPDGLGEGAAFVLALITGAFAHAVVTSVFAGNATKRMLDTLFDRAGR